MKDPAFHSRLTSSSQDFVIGVQPKLERLLKVTIFPIEALKVGELATRLDQNGVDAFYFDSNGQSRALASRVNYSQYAARRPAFSFRYGLFDKSKKEWDYNREFQRKLDAGNSSDEFILFPKLHVESFSAKSGSGIVEWSFAAETKQIVNFIQENFENRDIVHRFKPSTGEAREVISVSVERFAREFEVIEICRPGS